MLDRPFDRPIVPFRQFVLKVHSRCDLACDHCYVYEHADQSWRSRPKVMAPETVAAAARRIAEHARRHRLKEAHVVLHGGEPLLAGPDRLAAIAAELRAEVPDSCALDLRVHTNGVLLDDRFLDVFAEHDIRVGISLDGDRVANDRHRRYANGRSSYDDVIRAIGLLRARPELFSGLLCTVDVANDPVRVYRALVELEPPRVDFLLPHATWDAPPPRPAATAYADWLIAIYERWEADGRPVYVRLFDSIESTGRGGPSHTEAIGLEPSSLVVIETDGSYEQVDSLKVAYEDAPATGQHVLRDSLDDVAAHPGVIARQLGLDGLAEQCRTCPVVRSCGGGLYPHRYRSGSGFTNPSVFCPDLFKLIGHVHDRITMPAVHALPHATLRTLASGMGGTDEIGHLAAGQASLARALLAALRRDDADRTPDSALERVTRPAWDLLTQIDVTHRAALDTTLAHPYVRAWAVACLRGEGRPGYLANLAAAAALRAGLDAKLEVEVVEHAVHLPGQGTVLGARAGHDGTTTLVIEDGRPRLDGSPAAGEASWRPSLRVASGDFSVLLEDADPHRDCHQWPAATRLTEAEAAAWQDRFDRAWRLIEADHPAYAPGLRAGLTTLTPLAAAPPGRDVSSTARHAFGAVAAALPEDPATLALLIIHEFQHVKLGALLDMLDLHEEGDGRLYYAPWREDPRPLEGLLQGTYAHLAVTDYWRTRRHTAPDPAEREFARWRGQTAEAVETLATSGALTPVGAWFVSRMRERVAPWLEEPVAEEAEAAATRAARAHHDAFRR
ncbi:FxsB family cyclophane-forming radical SAM/SPASM peptide maturase [Microtetraspora malaysiensis]|uniref:FxsB family cyclophane-forming radical SAM/SPASM peptide maturase n=1 Tax=Microtetraspora malaysiensis TaxID=161358 RepID=UPI003D8C1550